MRTKYVLLVIIVIFVQSVFAGEKSRFFEMSPLEIDQLITKTSEMPLTITEKMNFFSEYFLDTPYAFTCVGDGEYALYEPYPLVNFDSTNCMAYCEHVLALSISDSWDNFFNNLQQIRYKDGLIGMRTRNHYTMADWLPENRWLLDDASAKVGGAFSKTVTRTISHQKFFTGKGITDLRHVMADRTLTIDYIPLTALAEVKKNLRNGDIGALIFANKTDIFSAHMWMVMKKDGDLVIRESTTRGMTTFDTAFDEWAKNLQNSKRYIGVTIMRVKDELNTPARIILPTDIGKLKK